MMDVISAAFWYNAHMKHSNSFARTDRVILAALAMFAMCTAHGECDVLLADGWLFSRDGSSWHEVSVPHDWAIEGPFDVASKDGDTGKLPWRGVGTYRRTFVVTERDAAGTVALDFDGVMARPKVYVNGKFAGGWDYGYQSFRVDATPFVVPGTNHLEVVADTRRHRSRWYPGGGINRKVVLKMMPKAHFVYNGIAVTTPVAEKDRAVVRVRWETTNAVESAQVKVRLLLDEAEKACRMTNAAKGEMSFELKAPKLWDVDSPCLYLAECTLSSGGDTATETVRFGIRKIAFPVGVGADVNAWNWSQGPVPSGGGGASWVKMIFCGSLNSHSLMPQDMVKSPSCKSQIY